jgi:uncharacterized protein
MKPVETKQELIDRLVAEEETIKSFGVLQLGFFGSFARNNVTNESDVDFYIVFDTKYKTLKNFVHLSLFLSEISGRKVEIVTPQSLNKFTGKYITEQVEYVPFAA